MPSDLHPRGGGAHPIGMVGNRRRKPQDAILNGLERRELNGSKRCHFTIMPRRSLLVENNADTDHGDAQIHRLGAIARYDRDIPARDLDLTDQRIVALLVADARLSASEIGRRVGLSPAAAKRRIDRLEANGVILGYQAVVDRGKFDGSIEAFIELRFAGETQVDDIESTANIPEVIEAFTTAGDPDALARIRVHDLDHLKRVVDRIRRTGRVTGTKTLIVLGGVSSRP